MPYDTEPLVDHAVYRVHWLDDLRFWYIDHDAAGDQYRMMDAATGKVTRVFNQIKLTAALSIATGRAVKAPKLSISAIRILRHDRYDVTRDGERFLCDLQGPGRCLNKATPVMAGEEPGILSPNGRLEAVIRNWNLWVRDLPTGKDTQLTFDGVRNFGYATRNAGWVHSNKPVLNCSPNSKEIATYRQDQRRVGDMYLVSARLGSTGRAPGS